MNTTQKEKCLLLVLLLLLLLGFHTMDVQIQVVVDLPTNQSINNAVKTKQFIN